jgi:hypothetical protein
LFPGVILAINPSGRVMERYAAWKNILRDAPAQMGLAAGSVLTTAPHKTRNQNISGMGPGKGEGEQTRKGHRKAFFPPVPPEAPRTEPRKL